MYSAYQKGKPGQVGAVWSVSTVGFTSVLVQQDVTLSEPHSLVDGTGGQVLLNPLQVFLLGGRGAGQRGGGEEQVGNEGRKGRGEVELQKHQKGEEGKAVIGEKTGKKARQLPTCLLHTGMNTSASHTLDTYAVSDLHARVCSVCGVYVVCVCVVCM